MAGADIGAFWAGLTSVGPVDTTRESGAIGNLGLSVRLFAPRGC